jgi:prevent-host-death family protein
MVEVGIKELKDGLSGYLRRVARGEHVRITSRGEPVADLIPAQPPMDEDPELLRLEADGKITLSRLPRPDRSPPPAKARRSASRYILDERESER